MAVVAEADKLRQQGMDVVDLGAGRAALRHAAAHQRCCDRRHPEQFHQVHGVRRNRRIARCDHSASRGGFRFGLQARRSHRFDGGKHVLFNAIQVLVDHGDEVILPVPYWVSFKDIVQLRRRELRAARDRREPGLPRNRADDRAADHAAHEADHPELAVESVRRGDVSGGPDRSRATGGTSAASG